MENSPLISVAMATYNGERHLREQLDSIFAQTFKNIEVVVTDDRSTDKTADILEEYKNNCGLIYHINDERLGFIKNFERAVGLCRGNYVALSDQDDIWEEDKLKILINEIGEKSLVCSDLTLIGDDGKVISDSYFQYRGVVVPSPERFAMFLNFNNFVTGCTTLIKNELFKKALPIPQDALYHDWWFAMVAARENGIKYVDKKLVLYRRHGGNVAELSKGNSVFKNIFRYFSSRHRKWWREERAKLQDILRRRLRLNLEYERGEEKALKESIHYIDLFLKSKFRFAFFKYGLKYRNHLFRRPIYFFLEYFAYLARVFLKQFSK